MAVRMFTPSVGARAQESDAMHAQWAWRLIVFMRVLAALEIFKGVVHWCQLLGIGAGDEVGFEGQSLLRQAVVIYFAILDPVAAVGLWMASPWGAVIWLFAAASQITILFVLPSFPPIGWLLLPYELAAIGAYLFLAYRERLVKHPLR